MPSRDETGQQRGDVEDLHTLVGLLSDRLDALMDVVTAQQTRIESLEERLDRAGGQPPRR